MSDRTAHSRKVLLLLLTVFLCFNLGSAPLSPAQEPHQGPPTIVFMTDFGAANDSVAICKAIMAGIAPEMDDDTWNHRLKSTPAKLMMGGGVLLAASFLLFPYFYTLFAFVRWIRKRRNKS